MNSGLWSIAQYKIDLEDNVVKRDHDTSILDNLEKAQVCQLMPNL